MKRVKIWTAPLSKRYSTQAPRFTTPEEPPVVNTKVSKEALEEVTSPHLYAPSTFYKAFRYAVFGSVGIVTVTAGTFAAGHLWVEKVELRGPKQEELDGDVAGWHEDSPGWSGAYLGGGTDPAFSFTARLAIRSAWMVRNWSNSLQSNYSSPFSSDSLMIGQKATPSADSRNANLLSSELYLRTALRKVYSDGLEMVEQKEGTPVFQKGLFGLEAQLAETCERIGTQYHLEQAREGWERIYEGLTTYAASSVNDPSWTKRQQVYTARKLGEIHERISQFTITTERAANIKLAEAWFLKGLERVLNEDPGHSASHSFWSSRPTNVRPEIAQISTLVAPKKHDDLPTNRQIVNLLSSLESFLSRSRRLEEANLVQTTAGTFINNLNINILQILPNTNSKTQEIESLSWRTPSAMSLSLLQLFLAMKASLFTSHGAEIILVRSKGKNMLEPLNKLQSAISTSENVIQAIEAAPLIPEAKYFFLPNSMFTPIAAHIKRDAQTVGSIAARVVAVTHERGCGNLFGNGKVSSSVKAWCGGDSVAHSFYAKAMRLLGEDSKADVGGFHEAQEGFERTRTL